MLVWLLFLGLGFAIPAPRTGWTGRGGGTAHPGSEAIPPTLFGMEVHIRPQPVPWPAVPIGSIRLSDNLISWAQINKSDGNYDWRQLDEKLADLKAHDIDDVLYTFRLTPSWASSKPTDNCARGAASGLVGLAAMPGECDPPADLNPDGTGADKHWKDFVGAIALHNKNSSKTAHITYWEIWNEPHNDFFWTGTFDQMMRMARDASAVIKSINPDAVILSPSVGLDVGKSVKWITGYLSAGGGDYADIIAFHGYVHSGRLGIYPSATDLVSRLNSFRNILAKYGQSSKTLWDTEASWGNAKGMGFEDEDSQAAFLAQFYLLHWSQGIPRLYWYAWNDGLVGTLWVPDPTDPSDPGRLTKAAIAYKQLFNWLRGSTMTERCSQKGSLWICGLSEADGHTAQIVWASREEENYSPNALPMKMRDLDGNVSTVSAGIKVNTKPVLLEFP